MHFITQPIIEWFFFFFNKEALSVVNILPITTFLEGPKYQRQFVIDIYAFFILYNTCNNGSQLLLNIKNSVKC